MNFDLKKIRLLCPWKHPRRFLLQNVGVLIKTICEEESFTYEKRGNSGKLETFEVAWLSLALFLPCRRGEWSSFKHLLIERTPHFELYLGQKRDRAATSIIW